MQREMSAEGADRRYDEMKNETPPGHRPITDAMRLRTQRVYAKTAKERTS